MFRRHLCSLFRMISKSVSEILSTKSNRFYDATSPDASSQKVAEKGKRDSECNEVWFRSIRVIISVGLICVFYISLEFYRWVRFIGLDGVFHKDFIQLVLVLENVLCFVVFVRGNCA